MGDISSFTLHKFWLFDTSCGSDVIHYAGLEMKVVGHD